MHREKLNLTYARWKEGRNKVVVDLVLVDDKKFKPVCVVEITRTNCYFEKPKELKSLVQFCNPNQFTKALIISIDKTGTKFINHLTLSFLPASVYCYNIGGFTLKMKTVNIRCGRTA